MSQTSNHYPEVIDELNNEDCEGYQPKSLFARLMAEAKNPPIRGYYVSWMDREHRDGRYASCVFPVKADAEHYAGMIRKQGNTQVQVCPAV